MSRSQWIASLWPGFNRACVQGKWQGLFLAIVFSAALNTALLTTFASSLEMPSAAVAALAWVLVLGFLAVGLWWQGSDLKRSRIPSDANVENRDLVEAQQHYLKGHWIEAESIVVQMLATDSADIEARLLLASIQRRTLRIVEAQHTLTELQSHPAAAKWQLEIASELEQLAHAMAVPRAA